MKTGIEIKTGFFPLAWFFSFVKPVIELNGEINKRSWGSSFFELPQGEHLVKIYFPYMGNSECGANQIKVKIEQGQTVKLSYYMPPWMFAKGKIEIT